MKIANFIEGDKVGEMKTAMAELEKMGKVKKFSFTVYWEDA